MFGFNNSNNNNNNQNQQNEKNRKKIVMGNWKMNNNSKETEKLVNELLNENINNNKNNQNQNQNVEVVIAPPFTSLETANRALKNDKNNNQNNIKMGAQDISYEMKGAYTGEISPEMLKDHNVEYVIIGHSERRHLFNESNEEINKKIKNATQNNLKAVLCVGETNEQKNNNQTNDVIRKQLQGGLKDFDENDADKLVIAYEPVWAIGSGKTPTPDEANEVCKNIRKNLAGILNQKEADKTPILYGGSVNKDNSPDFFDKSDIDGALVGGASLKAKDFADIAKAAILVPANA